MLIEMNEILTELIMWAIVIVIHELGHYLGFLMYKIPARLEIKWWGLQFDKSTVLNSSVNEKLVIALMGIFLGWTAVLFFNLSNFIYWVMCIVDLTALLLYVFIKPKYWNEKLKYLLYRKDVLTIPKLSGELEI